MFKVIERYTGKVLYETAHLYDAESECAIKIRNGIECFVERPEGFNPSKTN